MTTTIYATAAHRASLNKARPVSSGRPPAEFDPAAHPILARHWFGIEPTRQTSNAADMAACLKRRRQIEHLYRLGPRAVGELLCEVSEAEDLDRGLEAYARLSPDLLEALGADRFPAQPIHVVRP